MSDTNFAVKMIVEAFTDVFDGTILFSGDSDLTGPVKTIFEHFPQKEVSVAFPSKRQSNDLKKTATAIQYVNQSTSRYSQMLPTITEMVWMLMRVRPGAIPGR